MRCACWDSKKKTASRFGNDNAALVGPGRAGSRARAGDRQKLTARQPCFEDAQARHRGQRPEGGSRRREPGSKLIHENKCARRYQPAGTLTAAPQRRQWKKS